MQASVKSTLSGILLCVAALLQGCLGGNFGATGASTKTAPVAIVLSPNLSLTVLLSGTLQLSATYEGRVEPIAWSIRPSSEGVGRVTASGFYQAPAVLPSSTLAFVEGQSIAHPDAKLTAEIQLSNPVPSLSSVDAISAVLGTPLAGELHGATFQPTSIITVNGEAVPTTFISNNTLSFRGLGSYQGALQVGLQVSTPGPGGGLSKTIISDVIARQVTYEAAVRFLQQASWGPTSETIQHVQQVGFAVYLDEQMALPVDSIVAPDGGFQHIVENVWINGMSKPSQLRQKMMWTWYKLFNTPFSQVPGLLPAVPEVLQRDTFGNYTKLLTDVSLTTSTGYQLNHCCNQAAGPNPNQNFGREFLQLFSTGPSQLSMDGTAVLGGHGEITPAYTEKDVDEIARLMTGLHEGLGFYTDGEGLIPMVAANGAWAHDAQSKAVLGQIIPAGGTVLEDFAILVPIVASQPSTAPYLSQVLIHALVTSNPSPAYIGRVAQVWSDDGSGQRGNLAKVIKAILLDQEARLGDDPTKVADASSGRVMDAVEFTISVSRQLSTPGSLSVAPYLSTRAACAMNECGLAAPSVFGFFPAAYTLPGTQLLAPESALYSTPALEAKAAFLHGITYIPVGVEGAGNIDWAPWTSLAAGDGSALITLINSRLLHGTMSPGLRQVLLGAYSQVPSDLADSQAKRLLYLTLMSPEYAVIR